ncbi:MAG TPA: hypothetical protein VLS91_00720 [Acidimicrobiales bacterium]|nr:hypothetical protein [Acidimicrobiales bacterium]
MPAGRPRKELDAEQVYKLARLGCTNDEIGDFFGVSGETVRRNYVDALTQGRADHKISLRRWQTKRAQAGSDTMLIHLGKQYLGQSEKVEAKTEVASPVVILPHNGRDERPTEDPAPAGPAE